MRIALRLILSLAAVIAIGVVGFTALQGRQGLVPLADERFAPAAPPHDVEAPVARLGTRDYLAGVAIYSILLSLTTLLVVRWALMRPIRRTVEWMRRLRTGER
jgi:hypothetical protein